MVSCALEPNELGKEIEEGRRAEGMKETHLLNESVGMIHPGSPKSL